jgi:hypothetical protein
MSRALLAMLMIPLAASAADEHRLSFLEQEVRNLQRQVQALSRQLDEIRLRPERVGAPAVGSPRAPPPGEQKWVDAAKWRQLRPGMSELEVIAVLGPPTSMRDEDGGRVLRYAMEIGSSGFLGGSVTLRERAVVRILQPTLQ